jgi:DNA-binding XRE family transcriptional regulator
MTRPAKPATQSQVELLALLLGSVLPEARVTLDAPADRSAGLWHLDTELDGHALTVEWSDRRGFGLMARPDVNYGESPDERFPDLVAALPRIVTLLRNRGNTLPESRSLAQLRCERGLSQVELAKRLQVQQSAISRLENRGNVQLRKLADLVKAMGGEIELTAKFPDGFTSKLAFWDTEEV